MIDERPDNMMQHYEGVTLDLTGRPWFYCTFHRCVLRRDYRDASVSLEYCILTECVLEGDGWLPEWKGAVKS